MSRSTGPEIRVLVLENCLGATLGLIETALEEAAARIDLCRLHEGAAVPAGHDGHDALVLLGGVQNALDDANHPDLPQSAALARAFGEAGKAVLGVCLGAQIIARGYGGRNILGRPIEFGWHEVAATPAGRVDPVLSALGDRSPVFHWHTDTFDLPPDAVHLARSARTDNQAFRIGRAVYGIQFHFEASRALVRDWCAAFGEEIAGHTPDWALRHEDESARHGVIADAVGLEVARAWVARI